jgi:hypothetical protein
MAQRSCFIARLKPKKRTGPEARADAQRREAFDDWGAGVDRRPVLSTRYQSR